MTSITQTKAKKQNRDKRSQYSVNVCRVALVGVCLSFGSFVRCEIEKMNEMPWKI